MRRPNRSDRYFPAALTGSAALHVLAVVLLLAVDPDEPVALAPGGLGGAVPVSVVTIPSEAASADAAASDETAAALPPQSYSRPPPRRSDPAPQAPSPTPPIPTEPDPLPDPMESGEILPLGEPDLPPRGRRPASPAQDEGRTEPEASEIPDAPTAEVPPPTGGVAEVPPESDAVDSQPDAVEPDAVEPDAVEPPVDTAVEEPPPDASVANIPPEKPARHVDLPAPQPRQVSEAPPAPPSPQVGAERPEAAEGAPAETAAGTGSAPAGPAGLSGEQLDSYGLLLSDWLNRHKRYPDGARRRRHEGVATVAFTVDGQGRVLRYRIVDGTGSPLLDEEVEALLRRASPLPAPPDGGTHSFVVAIGFSLR